MFFGRRKVQQAAMVTRRDCVLEIDLELAYRLRTADY
jgi:hypothetical protein